MIQQLLPDKTSELFTVLKNKPHSTPLLMYGTGDGADKILDLCGKYGVLVDAVFSSDDFSSGKVFRGYTVQSFSKVSGRYFRGASAKDKPIVLLAFAVFRSDMLAKIFEMTRYCTLLVPDVPLFGKGYFNYDYLIANIDCIEETYSLLADELSRRTYVDVIAFRLTGRPEYLLDCESDRTEVFENIIKLGTNEEYVDLGAYDGDTVREFLSITGGSYRSITAFEPDEKNMKKLRASCGSLKHCRLLPYASWNECGEVQFNGDGGRMSCISGDVAQSRHTRRLTEARAVDGECGTATYIKMDVEGAEYETLLGCRRVIRECSPYLAVSAYHRAGDIFTLPKLIHSLNSGYEIYLRHHRYLPSWETNIYTRNVT